MSRRSLGSDCWDGNGGATWGLVRHEAGEEARGSERALGAMPRCAALTPCGKQSGG